MNYNFNLGQYRRPTSTKSDDADRWFNRGLLWCYGFNQEEAIRCFQHAIDADAEFAMAYWGMAYACGPFYNKPWEWYGDGERPQTVKHCHQYARKALELRNNASALEQTLIEAIVAKHPVSATTRDSDYADWMQAYADAMRTAYEKSPEDLDVLCLYAEALMNLTPWKLWQINSGMPAPGAHTTDIIELLERGIEQINQSGLQPHPGIAHFYIHAIEMSPEPEKALPQANQLRDLSPDCGHLLHMASHIDSLCGNWQDASDANGRGIVADRKYLKLRGCNEFYMVSVLHNYDFKMWAAMFLGQFEVALQAADELCSLVTPDMLTSEQWYLSSTLEGFYSSRVHVLVRFGKWQQICDEPLPDDTGVYLITTILLSYAKAIAFAALGDIDNAQDWQGRFERLYVRIPDWHVMANNATTDILEVARAMMNGEVEYHAGNIEAGFDNLREANRLHDQLEYAEPWAWMHPPRHALGALLTAQGELEEALFHYEDDLGIGNRLPRCTQHPDNIWALHGYHECLTRLGRIEEAIRIKSRLDELTANADVTIASSCCCRLETSA